MLEQRRWQRLTLLTVLGYEGLGSLLGGALLVAGPDGRYMDMPVGLMHGTFADFLIPGIILLGLGLLNVAAFFAVLRRRSTDWLWAGLALGGLAILVPRRDRHPARASLAPRDVGPPRHPGPDGGGPVAPPPRRRHREAPAIGVNIA